MSADYTDADVQAAREALHDSAVDHPMWIGNDGGALDYHPDRELYLGDFIDEAACTVLDAVVPGIVARAKAEALRDAAHAYLIARLGRPTSVRPPQPESFLLDRAGEIERP